MSKVEYYQDKSGEWRWHVKADNGKIVAASTEGYTRRANAEANYAWGDAWGASDSNPDDV